MISLYVVMDLLGFDSSGQRLLQAEGPPDVQMSLQGVTGNACPSGVGCQLPPGISAGNHGLWFWPHLLPPGRLGEASHVAQRLTRGYDAHYSFSSTGVGPERPIFNLCLYLWSAYPEVG